MKRKREDWAGGIFNARVVRDKSYIANGRNRVSSQPAASRKMTMYEADMNVHWLVEREMCNLVRN
jgi:hypothetical protein